MINIELFKTLIKEGQEVFAQAEINPRELELEEQGRYVFVGVRRLMGMLHMVVLSKMCKPKLGKFRAHINPMITL